MALFDGMRDIYGIHPIVSTNAIVGGNISLPTPYHVRSILELGHGEWPFTWEQWTRPSEWFTFIKGTPDAGFSVSDFRGKIIPAAIFQKENIPTDPAQPLRISPRSEDVFDVDALLQHAPFSLLLQVENFQNAEQLRDFLRAHNIDHEQYASAGLLLEAYKRAEQDGNLSTYTTLATRGAIEWALTHPQADGVHFFTDTFGEREKQLLIEATSTDQFPTGIDAYVHARKSLYHLAQRFSELGIQTHWTQQLEGEKFHELEPCLKYTYRHICKLKEQYPDRAIWNHLTLNFVRFTQKNNGQMPRVEHITSDDGAVNEIRIHAKFADRQVHQKEILQEIERIVLDQQNDDLVSLESTDRSSSFLQRSADSGWPYFERLNTLKGVTDVGTLAAKHGPTIIYSAQKLIASLQSMPDDLKEYVILEIGVHGANGIPQMLDAAKQIAKEDEKMSQKLEHIKIVGVDIAPEAVETFTHVMHESGYTHLNGFVGNMVDPKFAAEIYQKYEGKIAFVRSVNVNDALDMKQFARRKDNIYRVKYDTYISKKRLQNILWSPIGPIEQEAIIPWDVGISVKDVLTILQEIASSERDDVATAFLEQVSKKHHINEDYALLLWEKIINAFEKRHKLQTEQNTNPAALQRSTLHPDPFSFFYISDDAETMSRNIIRNMHPGASYTCFQLATSMREGEMLSKIAYILGITPCRPISKDCLSLISQEGIHVEIEPATKIGLNPNMTIITITKKK